MWAFYLGREIRQTPSAELQAGVKCSTLSSESSAENIVNTVGKITAP
jgi:hypothetical protein